MAEDPYGLRECVRNYGFAFLDTSVFTLPSLYGDSDRGVLEENVRYMRHISEILREEPSARITGYVEREIRQLRKKYGWNKDILERLCEIREEAGKKVYVADSRLSAATRRIENERTWPSIGRIPMRETDIHMISLAAAMAEDGGYGRVSVISNDKNLLFSGSHSSAEGGFDVDYYTILNPDRVNRFREWAHRDKCHFCTRATRSKRANSPEAWREKGIIIKGNRCT